jgi:acetylglutamate kinase
MDKLFVIKIGGNIIEDDKKLSSFLRSFAAIDGNKILVHGGGKLATKMAEQLSIPQQMVEGRRVTDTETLKVITMVYAGSVNKNIVASLQQSNCNAIGLTGADGDLIRSHKRQNSVVDFGWVGDVERVNVQSVAALLRANFAPVLAPLTHDGQGQLLNTNADTIAQEVAKSMSELYEVDLIYCFEKSGVLKNVNDEGSLIPVISPGLFNELKNEKIISEGMLPKLENAMKALNAGVHKIVIGKAEELSSLIKGTAGTTINHE